MKTIIIMRHGEALPAEHERMTEDNNRSDFPASNHQEYSPDYERELSIRGVAQIKSIAHELGQQHLPTPCQVYVSAARRTLQTWHHLLHYKAIAHPTVVTTPELYHAHSDTLLNFLWQSAESYPAAMLVGHNPSVSLLVERLSGGIMSLRPAQCIVLQCAVSLWTQLCPGGCVITHNLQPVGS